MLKTYAQLIACPDCQGSVREIVVNDRVYGFCCERCGLVYPVKDGILILLQKGARSYPLEYDAVRALGGKLTGPGMRELQDCVRNTLSLLESSRNLMTWESDEQAFWDQEYAREAQAAIRKNWNDRIWQREFLTRRLVRETKLGSRTILDCGSGEG
jgi:uncharacterized protein YbaR (Trm112 family)